MVPVDSDNLATLQEAAEDLRFWSRARGVESDPFVAELQEDLASGENLDFWASIEPAEMLPMPAKQKVIQYESIARLVVLIRNVLIFLPVALTWYAIGQATIAFQIYVGSSGTTTANFLDFWQNGYGILDDKWRIGEIAVLDFYIVMAVILISLVAGVIQAQAARIDSRLETVYERERMELALQISRVLHPYRLSSGSSNVEGLLQDVKSAAKFLSETSRRLERASASLAKLGLGYQKSTLRVAKEVAENSRAVRNVSSQLKKSSTESAKIFKSLKSFEKKFSRRLGSG
jgi:methyl-accepting chemotaxis protein